MAVLLYNCPEYFELYFGCARRGAILVPINFRLERPRGRRGARPTPSRCLVVYGPEFERADRQVRPQCPGCAPGSAWAARADEYESALAAMPAAPAAARATSRPPTTS